MGKRYKYLGKSVKDIRKKGLDSAKEFYGIMKQIKKLAKKGKISKKTARGELLLLYRLSFKKNNSKIKHLSVKTLSRIRKDIKKAMSSL